MASRTNDLTEPAKTVADQLARRTGSLKIVLSAGVIALEALDAADRETAISIANGEKGRLDLYEPRQRLERIWLLARESIVDWAKAGAAEAAESPFYRELLELARPAGRTEEEAREDHGATQEAARLVWRTLTDEKRRQILGAVEANQKKKKTGAPRLDEAALEALKPQIRALLKATRTGPGRKKRKHA